jgi:pilus assembly protein CpaF
MSSPRQHDHDDLIERVCGEAASVHGEVAHVVADIVDRLDPLLGVPERDRVVAAAVARLSGLGALERHLDDPDVDEVIVNAEREVWIERGGRLERVGALPLGAAAVIVERVLAPTGRRLDRLSPIVDVRLPTGARLCAVAEPVAVDGLCLAIRRHRDRPRAIADFSTDPATQRTLRAIVEERCNVLVSGATSSGKTSLLGALVAELDPTERVVVCEDTTELALGDRHAVRLEARPHVADGVPAVALDALVRTALRLRPDRLVVGEFRGDEVLAAIEAMNTGHDGSLSTCHANSAVDALRRVETLAMQAAPSWPLAAIRRHLCRCLDVVVHVARDSTGRRRVAEIGEVVDHDGDPTIRPLGEGRRGLSRSRRATIGRAA